MIALKYLLIVMADLMFVASFSIVLNDVWLRMSGNYEPNEIVSGCPLHWKTGVAIGVLAWVPLIVALLIAGRMAV